MKLKSRMRGVIAAIFAVMLALVVAPSTALATQGVDEGGTLTVNGLTPGDDVAIYQVVTTTYDETSNTLHSEFTHEFGIDWSQYQEMQDDATGSNEFANDIAAYILNPNNHVVATKTAEDVQSASTQFTDLAAGQYLVVVTPDVANRVFQNTIASVLPDNVEGEYVIQPGSCTVKCTTYNPEDPDNPSSLITKTVNNAEATDALSVKDTANFQINVAIPKYMTGSTGRTVLIEDSMTDGVTYNGASLKVMVGETELKAGTDYTTEGEGTTFNVKLKDAAIATYGGQTLTITYTGTVDSDAVYNEVDTNTATLTWSYDSYREGTLEASDTVTLSYYQLDVTKVDSVDGNKKLDGATFDVYKADNTKLGTITTDNGGKASFGALGAGDYYLVETKAPTGYDLDATHKVFTITSDGKPATAGNAQSLTISNTLSTATVLPETGGTGTVALTVVGVGLMAGAAYLVVHSRKEN